jgi:hypothetical protein
MIRDSNKIKYNLLFFCLDAINTKNKKMNNAKNEKLKRNTKETKKIERYDLVSEPNSDTE